ncbi:hypothetical protein HK100_004814 [Physocladia obscura]|uniref:TIR domain-containing protein n=1 Tax=Physocladia obscura TaxID=109957 RepID=A0AAD5T745_9FUNG|nr:hypothetical protein HK100_004814 [Physocladia obscura]
MTPQNNPNNQARWVGSSFEHVNALFSPVQTIVDNNGASKTTADTENNLKKLEDKSEIHKLKPDKIANELDQLQTDLKLLADAFARSKHLGKTEADKSLSAFFSKLRYNAEHFDALTVPDSNTVEDQTAYSAYKAMPHYTAVLSAASLLLKHETKDNPSLHPEEIYSIAKAKEQIYKLRSELAEKKEENVRLLNSIKEMNLDSSVLLPTSKSSLSTSYFPLAISDLVTRLQNTYSSNTFGIQSPQETVLDDPSAYLHACSGWMLSQQTYDFFISYRVATDAKIAMELYFRLQTQRICDEHGNFRNIRVYWDKECLENGQNWHDGFIEGLKNSRCILMLVSKGAIERMSTSDTQTDNVLLEWETAILAGQAKICIPQPIFIDDPKNKITGYDFLRSFLDSEKCPKFRPNTIGAHRQSAYTTLTALINLQGIHLKMEEVSWAIPACMTAVTNYDSIKAAAVAKQCHTESSFFNYFPKIEIDCLDYEIEFLSSNDLKELFGSEEEQKEGILKYNKQLENLKLIFRGLTQNYSFFSKLDLKNCRMNEGTIWIQFAAALKENTHLKVLNLSGNDIRDAPQLLHVIQNHKSLDFVRIGAEFDPLPFLQNKSSPKVTFDTVDSLGLDLFVEVCEIGKAKLNEIHIDEFKVDPNDDEKKFEDAVLKLGNYLSTLPALFEISLPDVLIDVATNCLNTSNSIITVHLGKLNPGKKKSVERHVYKTKQVFQGFELFCSALTIRSDSKTPYVLETIDLTNLSLTDEDMLIFGEAMKKTAVKNLILRNNGITSAGISQVLNSFSRKDLLKRIDFSSNLIGPFSFEAFLDFLKAATGLQELRLSGEIFFFCFAF